MEEGDEYVERKDWRARIGVLINRRQDAKNEAVLNMERRKVSAGTS